ncbi:phage integrase N-terminal SAM-like domain-containing protein [Halomonas caseinilytica]|uniref:phage integrase N-terminal SAM-like domain-containing protein n=1 Tax=Halomonas caseinilytica TaxID=438744 RepID=UPI0009F29429|nr:phage integrase N-terminal SAM-like domain-containing protein [Halomonas caseinilytica]
MRFFLRFHGVRHPASMGGSEVHAFLEHRAIQRHVAAATQNQALNALVLLYRTSRQRIRGFTRSLGVRRKKLQARYRQLPCTMQ